MNPVKRVAFACATSGLLAVAAPGTAYAATGMFIKSTPNDVAGICRYFAVNDTTTGGQLGGPNTYNGVVTIDFVTPLRGGQPTSASVTCNLFINAVNQGAVLGATGTGVVAAVGQLQFTASPDDFVDICATVQVASDPPTTTCTEGGTTDVDGVLGNGADLLDSVVCTATAAVGPTVNMLGLPSVIYVDPTDADLYLGGFLVYDCWPDGS